MNNSAVTLAKSSADEIMLCEQINDLLIFYHYHLFSHDFELTTKSVNYQATIDLKVRKTHLPAPTTLTAISATFAEVGGGARGRISKKYTAEDPPTRSNYSNCNLCNLL